MESKRTRISLWLIIFAAVKLTKACAGVNRNVSDGTGHLAFYFLNIHQLYKNYYFRCLFSTTLYPSSPYLCITSLLFLSRGRNKAVPFKQILSAGIEPCYRCLQASLFLSVFDNHT